MKQYIDESEEEQDKYKPLKIIGALFLVLMVLVLSIPVYQIKFDPNPNQEKIPELNDLLNYLGQINNNSSYSQLDYINGGLSVESMPIIRQAAVKISAESCRESQSCHAKALYYFTRDKIMYIEDPAKQYIQHPAETLVSGGGDCEDKAILLAYFLKAIDVPSRICLTYNHAYLEAYVNEKWVKLDATSELDFGEINPMNADAVCEIYI